MRYRGFSWRKAALCLGYACLFLAALRRPSEAARPPAEQREAPQPQPSPRRRVHERGSILARSVGLLFAATVVFALGAALGGAFAASAEDGTAIEAASGSASTDEITPTPTETDPVTTEETTTEEASTEEPSTPTEPTSSEPAPPPTETQPSATPSPGSDGDSSSGHEHSSGDAGPVLHHNHHSPRPPETKEGGAATIWLHRTLPDPTPPAERLSPRFAALLRSTAEGHGIHWWPVLAVLRADGRDERAPAGAATLDRIALRIANHRLWLDAKERSLTHYNRAVGLRALVVGLKAAKPSLERRILRDYRIGLTAAGASDIVAGRVDVRVLVAIRYLVVEFHQVRVSSLVTGHRFFARPGVMSAHVDGLAVDISAVKGLPIAGNQSIGGVAERAIEALQRLPTEVQPQQIISLLGLGGASFPQADHDDHIHIGF
jgi:hypothetical protein